MSRIAFAFILLFSGIAQAQIPLEKLHCPIPHEDRVRNNTGSQCVFSSIEMLGRWAEEPKLYHLTRRRDCQGTSSPHGAARLLDRMGIRYKQTVYDKRNGLVLIKKAMYEGRGCLFGVPGHAMVLVHYSEKDDLVCWVNNSNRSLKVSYGTVQQFHRMWDGWVLVICAEKDIIPRKISALRNRTDFLVSRVAQLDRATAF